MTYIYKNYTLHVTEVGRHDQSATTAPAGTLGLLAGGTRFEAVVFAAAPGGVLVLLYGWVGGSGCLKARGVVFSVFRFFGFRLLAVSCWDGLCLSF
jgi:hypothetical protein